MVGIKQLSPDKKRGYIAAREFLVSQLFLWLGIIVGAAHYFLADSWNRDASESALIGFVVSMIYLPYLYVRAVLTAWQVWRGIEEPPEITVEQQKAQFEAAQSALAKMGGSDIQ
jgi:hypothetical protein